MTERDSSLVSAIISVFDGERYLAEAIEVVFGHVREFVSPELPREIAARLRPPVENAPWPTPNLMLVRREAFERVGAYSTTIKVGIGVDWCARAAEARLKALVLPVVVLE